MPASPPSTPIRVIVVLGPEETHPLRRALLRGGDPEATVAFPGDDDASALHLGWRDGDQLVAVASFLPREDGVQIRGMAVEPGRRGEGLGAALLAEARRSLAGPFWANARVEVVGFYEAQGMVAVGDEFVTPDTGLPHRRVEDPE